MHDKRETVKNEQQKYNELKIMLGNIFHNGIPAYQKRGFRNAAQHLQRLANLSCFCAQVNTRCQAYVDLMVG